MGFVSVGTQRFLIRWFCGFEIEFISQADPHNFEGVEDDGTTRGTSDISIFPGDKDNDGEEEDAEWKKVSSPETNASFELSGCHTREAADVDCPVEPSVHPLNGDSGIDNDAFAVLLDLDETFGIGVLFNNQRRDVGFDSTGADANDNHGDDETSEVSYSAG